MENVVARVSESIGSIGSIESIRIKHPVQMRVAASGKDAATERTDVALVSMPFGPLYSPSLGLSLLKGTLSPLHISAKIFYFTMQFARLIGTPLYNNIAEGRPNFTDFVGEWIFAGALSSDSDSRVLDYLEQILRRKNRIYADYHNSAEPVDEELIEQFLAARQCVEQFLNQCVHELLSYQPSIIGFTSVFQQQIASLALAQRLKEYRPHTPILFGGANCEHIMGVTMIQQFPFIDAIVSGEAEQVFPELVQRLMRSQDISDLQGVYTRENVSKALAGKQFLNAHPVAHLDMLPVPEYDDFFEQWERTQAATLQTPQLLFETSRGCWWGEKHHCTFCGLNGTAMAYRSKSASRAIDELVTLTTTYPVSSVGVVDNILDMNYFHTFIPELTARQLKAELFYEVKANLKKTHIRQLRDAGILTIQPGIESLNTHVLKLMQKGVKALQNIQLLKWCAEFNVKPLWNLLWGFPGELPDDYAQMAQIIPLLTHLQPPNAEAAIRLDRFSPNFDYKDSFGLINVLPYPAYSYIYPPSIEQVKHLAYYFVYQHTKVQDIEHYVQPMLEQVLTWKHVHEYSNLWSFEKASSLLIRDQRPVAQKPLYILSGLQKFLYLACDSVCGIRQLQEQAQKSYSGAVSEQEIVECLNALLRAGLMLQEEDSFLSLAISRTI